MRKPDGFLDEESKFQGRYSKDVFEALLHAYRPMMGRIISLIAIGFAGRVLLLSNANLIGYWVDSLCREPVVCRPVPGWLAGFDNTDFLRLLAAVTLLGFACTALFRVAFSRASAIAVSRFYDEVTLRTSRLPMSFFDNNPVGRIVTRFSSDYGNVFRLFGGPMAEFLSIIFDLIAMAILAAVASPYYLPLLAVIALMNFSVYRFNRNRLRLERRALSAIRSPSIAHFAETTQGASTIRIFGRQRTFFDRFVRLNTQFLDQRLKTTRAVLGFSGQMNLLTAILLLSTGLLGYWLSGHGLLSIGAIGVAFTFVMMSGTSTQMFFEWMAQFEEAMTGVERLNDYLRRPLEAGAKLPSAREFPTDHPVFEVNEEVELKKSKLVASESAAVSIEGLWFRYAKDLPPVLKGIDLQIQPGEKIGIIGRTGSGKSSLVQALFRLYPIEKGRIAIDGKSADVGGDDHKQADLGLYRRSIALISQEPTLFRGTLRENLDMAGLCSDQEMTEAIKRVGLGPWFSFQAQGLDSMVEERGRNLSAGERQLLCMARCLLQDAPIVVMDEATSSVDPQSEEILIRATEKFFANRTVIIIAHRLSTLESCDRIVWLHDGEIRMFDQPSKILPVFQSTQLA